METTFTEPVEPSSDKSKYAIEKYKQELSRYNSKIDQYEEYKSKVFVIIKGQCSLAMKNKVESMTDYSTWEQGDDVIALLNAIKELSFSTVDVQYEYWTLARSMKNVMMMRQHDKESLQVYYKRFTSTAEVAESQWGLLVPTKKTSKTSDQQKNRDKFLTCMFLAGVDQKRYGKMINELNNAYLAGQKNYPTTVEGATTMLSHYMHENASRKKAEYQAGRETSFAQRSTNIKCFRCGQKGHIAKNCTADSDDESITTAPSTTGSRQTWSSLG